MPDPLGTGLSIKHEIFAHKYIELEGNGTKAAIEAGLGGTEGSAAVAASVILRRPKMVQRLVEIANEVGLTSRKALSTVKDALDASKALVVAEEVTYEPDWNARLRASDLALRVHGLADGTTQNNLNVYGDDFFEKLAETFNKNKSLENK